MYKHEEISSLIYNKISSKKDILIKEWNNPKETNTKHLILDNLLPDNLCIDIYNSFPKDLSSFYERNSFRERKKTSANMSLYNKNLNDALYAFQEEKVIKIISEITNIMNLEADRKLYAGGISVMEKGDFLNPHIDNSHDIKRLKYRRLNLLYYVTPKWKMKNGGNFELWDKKVKLPKTIISNFNRLVIMETTRASWHSVSKVISRNTRCCISNYYFTEEIPKERKKDYFHVTSFTGRPSENFRRLYGSIDNVLRNTISRVLRFGRGKKLINKREK